MKNKGNVHKQTLGLWCAANRLAIDGVCDPRRLAKALKGVIKRVRTRRIYSNKPFQIGDRKFSVLEAVRPSTSLELFESLGKLKHSVCTREEARVFFEKYSKQIRLGREGILFIIKEDDHFILLRLIPKEEGSRESVLCYANLYQETTWHKILLVVPQIPIS